MVCTKQVTHKASATFLGQAEGHVVRPIRAWRYQTCTVSVNVAVFVHGQKQSSARFDENWSTYSCPRQRASVPDHQIESDYQTADSGSAFPTWKFSTNPQVVLSKKQATPSIISPLRLPRPILVVIHLCPLTPLLVARRMSCERWCPRVTLKRLATKQRLLSAHVRSAPLNSKKSNRTKVAKNNSLIWSVHVGAFVLEMCVVKVRWLAFGASPRVQKCRNLPVA